MKPKTNECECCDMGCVCNGTCHATATTTLFRIDMDDYDGTRFCEACAADAMESGVFSDEANDTDSE